MSIYSLAKRTTPIYSFILNAKGRIVHDLLVYAPQSDEFLLETDQKAARNLERTLKLYRLRRKLEIAPVNAQIGFSPIATENAIRDPRVSVFGYRIIGDSTSLDASPSSLAEAEREYRQRRLEWGIAEGHDELYDQIPLNTNGDIMNGINFDKGASRFLFISAQTASFARVLGCYVGQELVARTHHTGVVRRRVVPFRCSERVDGFILDENNRKQGKVLRSSDTHGLALLALKRIGSTLRVNDATIETFRPAWWPDSVLHYPETAL